MNFINEINNYIPKNGQELQDKKIINDCIKLFPNDILLRTNEIAHITSSSFVVNKSMSKVLMIHHNIRNVWSWTGGHADGDSNLLEVASRETTEETGVQVVPISKDISSVDVFTVSGHMKNNKYVNSHLHLSLAYLFTADESADLIVKPDENSAIRWFAICDINESLFSACDVYLYKKLLNQVNTLLK